MDNGFELDNSFADNVDLTPLIDVIFLLLLFFILATTFLKPAVNVTLPTAQSGSQAEKTLQMVVTIDNLGQVFFEGRPVFPEALPALLDSHRDRPLNFMIDRQAPFHAFIGVLDQARLQGREDFIITTEHEDAPRP